jgi:ribosome-binding protein aMBF1 (putative translation factor)
MQKRRDKTSDALELIDRLIYHGKPVRQRGLAEMQASDEIGRKIRDIRLQAGLSQAQLGKLIGSTASVICRLEDADYEGHSLAMLRRIATALHKRLEIRFVPARKSA